MSGMKQGQDLDHRMEETGRDYGIETGRDWNRDKATGCEMEMITA